MSEQREGTTREVACGTPSCNRRVWEEGDYCCPPCRTAHLTMIWQDEGFHEVHWTDCDQRQEAQSGN